MTHCVILLLATLLAQAPQTVSPVGRSTQQTVKIEGCKGQVGCIAVPVDIGGTSVSATTTCHATTAAPTYVDGTDDPLSCDLAGTLRTSAGGGGSSDVAIHDNVTPSRHLTVDASGLIGINNFPASQAVTGTFWQATQPVSLASGVDITDRAARLLGHVTVDNASLAVTGTFWQATQPISSTQLPAALDGSGFFKVHEQGTAAVSGTFWQATQPVSGTFWPTLANAPASHRLSDGTNFYDAAKTGQLPTALVGGRLDVNIGAGSIANTAFAQNTTAQASASDTGTCTNVSVNTTVLASAAGRHVAVVLAKVTNTDRVHLKLGATSTTSQPPLEPGQSFTMDSTAFPYTGQIDAIAASGTQSVCTFQW
jgi:hypothetical protein